MKIRKLVYSYSKVPYKCDVRTKHQTSMMELQEQIERMSREKEKVVKEKSVMKTEISELYAQIEILQSEKVSIKKVTDFS
jgi:hypothetical protein